MPQDRGAGGYGVPLPAQTRHFATPDIALGDDDGGQPLFGGSALAPGSRVQNCVAVTYRGSAAHVQLLLTVNASGVLADGLTTAVEVGSGGRFKDCTGFTPRGQLFAGTLAELSSQHGLRSAGLIALASAKRGETATFRFTFVVADQGVAQGATAGADFLWTARG